MEIKHDPTLLTELLAHLQYHCKPASTGVDTRTHADLIRRVNLLITSEPAYVATPEQHAITVPLAVSGVPERMTVKIPLDALSVQVGGNHYKSLKIQPVEYCQKNGLGFCESSVVKYVSRWKAKNGIKDLEKAKHFIDLLIQIETEGGAK